MTYHRSPKHEELLRRVTKTPGAYRALPRGWMHTYSLAMAAVSQDGMVLADVPKHMKNRRIVSAAVTNCGGAIVFAPVALKDDETTAMKAITNNPKAYSLISERLRGKASVAIYALVRSVEPLYISNMVPATLKDSAEFIKALKYARSAYESEMAWYYYNCGIVQNPYTGVWEYCNVYC